VTMSFMAFPLRDFASVLLNFTQISSSLTLILRQTYTIFLLN